MALNQAYDRMLALAPRRLWRINESSGTVIADSSGNALDGTLTAGTSTLGTAGPLYTGKNDASTNTRWTAGTGAIRRTGESSKLTNTNANLGTSGVTWCQIVRVTAGSTTRRILHESRNVTANNGLSVRANDDHGDTGNPALTVQMTDSAGNSSYLDFTDNTETAFWNDSSDNLLVVRARAGRAGITFTKTISANSVANATVITTTASHAMSTGDTVLITGSNSTPSINGRYQIVKLSATTFSIPVIVTVAGSAGTVRYIDEVLECFLNGIKLQPTASAAAALAANFADPTLVTQAHSIGYRYDGQNGGASDANGAIVMLDAWYNYLLTEEQILSILFAASYTVGNATYGYASMGLNGGFHGDANGNAANIAKPNAAQASVGDYVGYWISEHSGSIAGVNTANDTTNPKLFADAIGRRAIGFDGVMQASGGCPLPTLSIPTPFTGCATRMSIFCCAQPIAGSINAIGVLNVAQMARVSATANKFGLQLGSNQIGAYVGNGNKSALDPLLPTPACFPSPGVFGASTGTLGTVADSSVWCNGASSATTVPSGSYWLKLDGSISIGSIGGATGFFPGLIHELFIANRPLHARERAALQSYWDNRWQANLQDTLVELWQNSIGLGYANSSTVTNFNLWQAGLSATLQRRIHWRNASLSGAQSGPLYKNDGTGTAFGGNGDDHAAQDPTLLQWSSKGYANPAVFKSAVMVWEGLTNDIGHADAESSGDISSQSIQNFLNDRSAFLARNPKGAIVVMIPPQTYIDSLGASNGKASGNNAKAWFVAHPEMYTSYVQPTGLTSWVHPTAADYPLIGNQLNTPMSQAISAASSSGTNGCLAFGLL